MRSDSRPLHVAAFASIAIAQPLFDLLGRAPEFLIAHDLGPSEILAVAAALCAGLPLVFASGIALLSVVHRPTARGAATALVAFFVTLIVLYAIKNMTLGAWPLSAVAAGVGAFAGACYHRSAAARSFAT